MDLKQLQKNWDGLGAKDPLWAILTDPSKQGGRWDIAEFFAVGEQEIAGVMTLLQALHVSVNLAVALDFGCGVGRLTQALARRFESVYGVDIAPSMIEQAKRLNTSERCQFLVNQSDDLSVFPSEFFDFIYTNIVLQHMEPRYGKKYLAEFLRTLKRGGVLCFEVPDRPRPEVSPPPRDYKSEAGSPATAPAQVLAAGTLDVPAAVRNHSLAYAFRRIFELGLLRKLVRWFSQTGSRAVRRLIKVTPAEVAKLVPARTHVAASIDDEFKMEMYAVPREVVKEIILGAGCRLLHEHETPVSGPEWIAYMYVVLKP